MANQGGGYLGNLLAALLGRCAPVRTDLPVDVAVLHSRVAALDMDLRERDQRIETMRNEYEHLQSLKERASEDAGQEELEQFFKKAAGPLSNLAALIGAHGKGHAIELADLVTLVATLEKVFQRHGLERIGDVGEKIGFDVAIHQRMSGGSVSEGKTVEVLVPGYRTQNRVLMKAMVTSKEN